MKKIMKNYYFPFVLLLSLSCYSQINKIEDDINRTKMSHVNTFDLRSDATEGSSYVVEEFSPVRLSNDEKIYLMRYNAFKDEMEINKDDKLYFLPKVMDYTVTFINNNKVYQIFTDTDKDSSNKDGFFVVLFKGDNISLLLKEKIIISTKVDPILGYDQKNPPKLKRLKDELYIGYKNNTIREFPRRKKDILKLFSTKSNEIKSYAKKNNLNLKNKKDLIKIFAYYDSLK